MTGTAYMPLALYVTPLLHNCCYVACLWQYLLFRKFPVGNPQIRVLRRLPVAYTALHVSNQSHDYLMTGLQSHCQHCSPTADGVPTTC